MASIADKEHPEDILTPEQLLAAARLRAVNHVSETLAQQLRLDRIARHNVQSDPAAAASLQTLLLLARVETRVAGVVAALWAGTHTPRSAARRLRQVADEMERIGARGEATPKV